MMIKREAYMRRIRPFIGKELIKVLTGIRQSGKSVMLKLIQEELVKQGVSTSQFISLNFEETNNAHLFSAETLHEEMSRRIERIEGKAYLFFDEIQNVTGWEKCVNSLRVKYDCDIYVTGSGANLLSGEYSTYLSGRYVEFVVYPLSFAEFSEMYYKIFPTASQQEVFAKYLFLGGMPYLGKLRYAEEPSRKYLQNMCNSIILRDIVKRNRVRNVDLLERIIVYVSSNAGTIFSTSTMTKHFKNEELFTTPETIRNYLKYCEEACLFHCLPKRSLQNVRKYYLADHGIREAIYGGNLEGIEPILENIVFVELRRRGYKVSFDTAGAGEIDFIAEKPNEKVYIQVCYLLASEEVIQREFGVYDSIRDNYPKYVVSLDEFDLSRNGIKHKNIRDFLLLPEWN